MNMMWYIAIAAIAAFYLIVAVWHIALRPRLPAPAPATPELTDVPPAVVNLLTHRMKAPQATSATLLDLAARRVVELIEVGPQTLVRLRAPAPTDPRPYEEQVLERLRRVAGNDAVAVRELRARYAEGSDDWHKLISRQVAQEARQLGLTRSRDGDLAFVAMICAAIAVAPIGLIFSVLTLGIGLVLWALVAIFGGLALYLPVMIFLPDGDRLTPLGRRVTAHWLGVAEWLRAHEPLRDLPPAAVAVWDRYLAYGAALGVMPNSVAVLDLETAGRRDVVYSEHTGIRRPVRVNYRRRNRFLWPIGPAGAKASRNWAGFSLLFWGVVAFATSAWTRPFQWVPVLICAVAVLQFGRAAYRFVRSTMDIWRPTRMIGTVIDITIAHGIETPADVPDPRATLPSVYNFVVDDGSTDEVRPWLVISPLAGRDRDPFPPSPIDLFELAFAVGDIVYLEGEPHSRYVSVLTRRPVPAGREGEARPRPA
jgi:hypothetical protein